MKAMHLRRTLALACLLALPMLGACAAGGPHPPEGGADVARLQAPGPYQRFIVKYRADSAPGRDPQAVQPRLDKAADGSGPAVRLQWLRRMGVQADVFQADAPLDRERAQQLLDTLAADPDVEYVEVDGRVGIDPRPPLRQSRDLR